VFCYNLCSICSPFSKARSDVSASEIQQDAGMAALTPRDLSGVLIAGIGNRFAVVAESLLMPFAELHASGLRVRVGPAVKKVEGCGALRFSLAHVIELKAQFMGETPNLEVARVDQFAASLGDLSFCKVVAPVPSAGCRPAWLRELEQHPAVPRREEYEPSPSSLLTMPRAERKKPRIGRCVASGNIASIISWRCRELPRSSRLQQHVRRRTELGQQP
jgi:hypothetical protein